MMNFKPCLFFKNKGALGISVVFLLINGLVLSYYIRRPENTFISSFKIVGDKLKTSLFATSFKVHPPKIVNISLLSKELNLSYADWMSEPIINPFPYNFIHNPHDACVNKVVELLICVPVSRSNFVQRQAVRETWGSFAKYPSANGVLLFFIGNSSANESPSVQKRIDSESHFYGDIVQGDFVDSYHNLTLKSISLLRWMDAYCPQADFLIKADDDMYILVPKLLQNMKKARDKVRHDLFILGCAIIGAKPVQDKTSKWYTPKELFAEKEYPMYASGTSYSLTGKTARLLLQAALRTRLFWLEDVYVTGLCSRKAGVQVVNDWSVTFNKPPASACQFRKYTTGHRYSVAEIRKIHREILDIDLQCPTPQKVTSKEKPKQNQ